MRKKFKKLLVAGLFGIVFMFLASPRVKPKAAFLWGTGITTVLLFWGPSLLRRKQDGDVTTHSDLRTEGTSNSFPNSYSVIDIETTGLNPETSEIVELAAIRVRNGMVVGSFQELTAIEGMIPKDIVEKTHITEEMLSNAKNLKTVLMAFFDFVGNDILIGYNVEKFDVPFISFHSEKLIGRSLRNKTVDVWALAVRLLPGLPNYRLDTLRRVFNFDPSGAHRALKDCNDTNAVYQMLRSRKKKPRASFSKVKVKSIYRMTDADFQLRFGEHWQIAAEIVSAKKEMIANGIGTDWDAVREGWSRATPATESQLAMLTGAGIPVMANLSKRNASLLLDDKLLELDVNREVERRRKKAEKEAAKIALRAERERQRAVKENERAEAKAKRDEKAAEVAAKRAARQAELEHYDGPRMYVSPKRMAQWCEEFSCIWNGILADDVIQVDELIMLKNWLNRHKRRRDDFYSMLKLIDEVIADGIVTEEETQRLYASAVEVLSNLSADAENASNDLEEASSD